MGFSCLLQSQNQFRWRWSELLFYPHLLWSLYKVDRAQSLQDVIPVSLPQQSEHRGKEFCAEVAFFFYAGIWFLWLFNPTGIVPALSFWVSAVEQYQIKRVQTLRNLEQAWVSSLYLCTGDNTWEDSFLLGSVGGFHELGQVEVPCSWQIAMQSKMVLI